MCTGTGEDLVALWSRNLSNVHVESMWRGSLHCGIEAHEESPSLEKSGGAGEVTVVLCILTAVTPAPLGQVVLSTSEFIFLHLYLHPCPAAERCHNCCAAHQCVISPVLCELLASG